MLLLVGALACALAALLFAARPVAVAPAAALATLTALAALVLPWARLPRRVVLLLGVITSAELAFCDLAAGAGGALAWLLVLGVVLAAASIDSRPALAVQVIAAAGAVAVMATGGDGDVATAVVGVPVLVVLAAIVAGLREGLVNRSRELEQEVRRDPLTGLGNRRLLDERLAYELARHGRTARPLALLVLDLNRFKAVNDELGHPAGDRMLRHVGALLLEVTRVQDTVVRLGGDEFLVLAPESGAPEASRLSERLREALATVRARDEPLRAAVGFAVFPDDGTDAATLVEAADRGQRADKRDTAPPHAHAA